jgi:hypothetical protein
MKTAIVCTAVLLLMTAPAKAQGNGSLVYLDNVEGLVSGYMPVGDDSVTFTLGILNGDWSNRVRAFRIGLRVYGSDSSITWYLHYWAPLAFTDAVWPGVSWFVNPISGAGTDTIKASADDWPPFGIPPGYGGEFIRIRVVVTDAPSHGGTFCLDSTWFPPDGEWKFHYGSTVGSFRPDWNGPHCWPIAGCVGMRGNVDCDPDDVLDISDLVYLVDYQFTGGPVPPCWEEADIDGSGGDVIDITDLIWLMEYMFDGGLPPAACP